jgi:hypothetical protein
MTPAHGPDFKGEKMKKKAVKKGTPSAKTLRGRRSAPSKKRFRKGMRVRVLEVVRNIYAMRIKPGPGVVDAMLPMIGNTYPIERVCPDGDLYLGGWYFLPQWVSPVQPPKSPKWRGK